LDITAVAMFEARLHTTCKRNEYLSAPRTGNGRLVCFGIKGMGCSSNAVVVPCEVCADRLRPAGRCVLYNGHGIFDAGHKVPNLPCQASVRMNGSSRQNSSGVTTQRQPKRSGRTKRGQASQVCLKTVQVWWSRFLFASLASVGL
jgi:hypothetical protein